MLVVASVAPPLAGVPLPPPQAARGAVSVAGATLHYVRVGTGPTLFVIGSSVCYPRYFSADLAKHFDVVYADGRHFDPSYQPTPETLGALTLDTFADDVEAVRTALGVPRMAVLGHSVHAQIALRYAQRYPDRVSHVVLVCGVPYAQAEYAQQSAEFWERDASLERKALLARNRETLERELATLPPTRTFAARLRAYGPRFWANPGYDGGPLVEGVENSPAIDRLYAILPSRAAIRTGLTALTVPTLVALGRYDYAIPHLVWKDLLVGIDGISIRLFERSGHNPQTEEPAAFNEWLTRRLRPREKE